MEPNQSIILNNSNIRAVELTTVLPNINHLNLKMKQVFHIISQISIDLHNINWIKLPRKIFIIRRERKSFPWHFDFLFFYLLSKNWKCYRDSELIYQELKINTKITQLKFGHSKFEIKKGKIEMKKTRNFCLFVQNKKLKENWWWKNHFRRRKI